MNFKPTKLPNPKQPASAPAYEMLAYETIEVGIPFAMSPNYRRCISCRKVDHKSAFWRVVRVFPAQQVQLDQGMGRSVYLCPQVACLQAAQKKDRLGRALKATVPAAIYQTLWQRLIPEHPTPDRPSTNLLSTNLPEGEYSE